MAPSANTRSSVKTPGKKPFGNSKKPSGEELTWKGRSSKKFFCRKVADPAMLKFTPSKSERASFLGIPPEMRVLIYQYLRYVYPCGLYTTLFVFSYPFQLFSNQLRCGFNRDLRNLLCVNRLIYQESLPTYYSGLNIRLECEQYVQRLHDCMFRLPSVLSPNWIPGHFLQKLKVHIDVKQGHRRHEALLFVKRLVKASPSWKRLRALSIRFEGDDSLQTSLYRPRIFSRLKTMRLDSLEKVSCVILTGSGFVRDEECLELERVLLGARDDTSKDENSIPNQEG